MMYMDQWKDTPPATCPVALTRIPTAYSLQKNPGETLKFLELALKKGYKEWSYILTDHELAFMRKILPFKKLVNKYYRLFQSKKPRI